MTNRPCSECRHVIGEEPTQYCAITLAYCVAERALNNEDCEEEWRHRPCGKDGRLFEERTNDERKFISPV